MLMAGKQIGARIDPELYKKFVEYVKNKYNGRTLGTIAIELEEAIRNHITEEEGRMLPRSRTSTDTFDPETSTHTQKSESKYDGLISGFERRFESVKELKRDELESFIIEHEDVSDPRTIERKINVLDSKGVIESKPKGVFRNKHYTETISVPLEYNYKLVKDYFVDEFEGKKIKKDEAIELPEKIQDALFSLKKKQYEEFIEKNELNTNERKDEALSILDR
jgi:hypothetical protein